MVGLMALGVPALPAAADVFDYVNAPDDSYQWEVGQALPGAVNLRMVSQTWQGIPWQHTITVFEPQTMRYPDLAVLMIWAGRDFNPNDPVSLMGRQLANSIGARLAVLWNIPNQPLWGMGEDDLIAHTFMQALQHQDLVNWPLLFPMTKSAVRAMDTLQAWSAEQAQPIERFVVTGASKRGWTTWLTGAVDDRVAGIMPMVIDILNMPQQLPHMMELWGRYSPMIADYTRRGLHDLLTSPEGQTLTQAVDPFAYRGHYDGQPRLLIMGTNDPYWTLDALNLYRDELPGPTHQLYIPNAGHDLAAGLDRVLGGAVGFSRHVAEGRPLPELTWEHGTDGGDATLRLVAPGATAALLWTTVSEDNLYTDAEWHAVPMVQDGDTFTGRIPLTPGMNVPVYGEAQYPIEGLPGVFLPLCTTVRLHPPVN